MSAPVYASFLLNIAMSDAADAVFFSRCYGEASRLASRATGPARCYWAGVASSYARKARRAAQLHNAALASIRG